MKKLIYLTFLLLPMLSHSQIWKRGNGFQDTPFYKKKGTISIHLTNLMFSGRKTSMPPINLVPQVTAARNFTLGPMFTYFSFKRSEYEAVNATRWINPDISYHEFMIGLRTEYHITDLLQHLINRKIPQYIIDAYVAGWAGYSFVKSDSEHSDETLISQNETVRYGVSAGARSLFLKWFGISIEGGYSSYGYCSFGLFFVVR